MVEVHICDGVEPESVAERFRQRGYDVSYLDDATGEIVPQAPIVSEDLLLIACRR